MVLLSSFSASAHQIIDQVAFGDTVFTSNLQTMDFAAAQELVAGLGADSTENLT